MTSLEATAIITVLILIEIQRRMELRSIAALEAIMAIPVTSTIQPETIPNPGGIPGEMKEGWR